MNWINVEREDFFNLDDFFHIWIQHCPNGFFAMGQRKNDDEEICLSRCFSDKLGCYSYILNILGKEFE